MTKNEFKDRVLLMLDRDYDWMVLSIEQNIKHAVYSYRFTLLPRTQLLTLVDDMLGKYDNTMNSLHDRVVSLDGFYDIENATNFILDAEDYCN